MVNTGNTAGDAYRESLDVITTIKKAWERGHTLVPLVGAGISVDSGMPLVDSIISYLVMIRQYVGLKAYRPKYVAAPYSSIDEDYQAHPIRYIRHYGWPDRFQLRHELMLQYPKTERGEPGYDARQAGKTFDDWIAGELDEVVSSLKKWQKAEYDALLKRYRQLGGPSGPPADKVRSTWWMLGDWRAMIREFTEFTIDDADSLFERLYRWHKPGRSHHFFAFLTRLMGLRLFLTTNFDNFLERALTEQGIDHRVFGVEHGDNLPHESLVRETVSVIKLHGDTHQLLVDEKLDYPPSPAYLKRLQACMPKRPILVVMGCGGNDARILQVVQHHADANGTGDRSVGRTDKIPSVLWLHFEHAREGERTLEQELGNEIMHARVTNPGLFLSHLYAVLRSQHPASRVPYQTHLPQPIAPMAPGTSPAASIATYHNEHNVFIYEQRCTSAPGERVSASQVMADFVYTKKTKDHYTPIWINLEAHHSVGGVVQQIVEQCRVHDTFVSPFDVPSREADPEGATIALTAARLFHVLRRGRYVLAFDALEAFPWPPTAHHGASSEQESAPEIGRLFTLLHALMTHDQLTQDIGVVICASFDVPKRRRDTGDRSALLAQFSALVTGATGAGWTSPPDGDSRHDERPRTALSEYEFVLSCFRRPRSLVSLSSVFDDIFGDQPDDTNDRLSELVEAGCLVPIEGGFFRMRRGERDDTYGRRSLGTGTDDIKRALGGPPEHRRTLIEKCYSLASTHGLVARCYYSDSYLHSFDPWIFFEYFYHRISSVRYITKLVVLLEAVPVAERGLELDVVIPPMAVVKKTHRGEKYTLAKILAYVAGERASLVQALKHAFNQAQVHLLRGLPATQLEAWCKGVLDDNFWFRVDAKAQILNLAKCPSMKAHYVEDAASTAARDTAELAEDVSGIFWSVLGLLRKSLYHQGRNREASDVAWVQLAQNAEQVRRAAPTPRDAPSRHQADQVLDWLRDMAAARGPDDPRARPAAIGGGDAHEECVQSLLDVLACTAASEQVRKLQALQAHYAESSALHLLGKQNQLRVLCLLCEGRLTDLTKQRFDAHLRPLARHEERQARLDLVDEALAVCRVVSPHGARDSSHDPYYLRFRARLLMAQARLQWIGVTSHLAFRDSDWYLESARASVSSDDHARLARLDMAWTEGLLLQANYSLNGGCVGQSAREDALASARVDYLRAGDALQRAREHLTRGTRDVELWACYQRLWAQYQAEWCLFQLAQLECELRDAGNAPRSKRQRALAERAPRDIAALLKRLKRGLNGLQAGLVVQPEGNRDPWLRRIWLELLCAGMVYGMTVAAGTVRYEAMLPAPVPPAPAEPSVPSEDAATWPLGIATFWAHWRLMNERAGIAATVELEGHYTTYLAQQIEDPSELRPTWRTELIASLHTDGVAVSKLRADALALAARLIDATPGELGRVLRDGIARLLRLAALPAGTMPVQRAGGDDGGAARAAEHPDVPQQPVG